MEHKDNKQLERKITFLVILLGLFVGIGFWCLYISQPFSALGFVFVSCIIRFEIFKAQTKLMEGNGE